MCNNDYASKQLNKIRNRISLAAHEAGRNPSSVTLIGAAKQQAAEQLDAFHAAGLQHVGENYLAEALEKQLLLGDQALTWHFIGKLQSNKSKAVAAHFSWVHSIDRYKLALRLAAQTPEQKTLQILIQLDIDNETSKGGIDPASAPELCARIAELSNLRLRGFMLIPKARESFDEQRRPFAAARQLMAQCNQRYDLAMDTLSMGMSNDLEAAVAEGSTMVRIGTDLFGARAK